MLSNNYFMVIHNQIEFVFSQPKMTAGSNIKVSAPDYLHFWMTFLGFVAN
jgi:hypothetical protein